MFQCLENQYDLGVVNYDKRKRNILIQTDTECNSKYSVNSTKFRKKIKISSCYKLLMARKFIESNYFRELLYNLEHCIHQALIKVAILQCETVTIDPNFGVARSTIEYKINVHSKFCTIE
jgi:hypothetical protein